MTNKLFLLLPLSLYAAACTATPDPAIPEEPVAPPVAPTGTVLKQQPAPKRAPKRAQKRAPKATPAPDERGRCPTPGEKVFVPDQSKQQVMCESLPPECGPGKVLGAAGICWACIPDVAPMNHDSDCVCNDDRRWVCTEAQPRR